MPDRLVVQSRLPPTAGRDVDPGPSCDLVELAQKLGGDINGDRIVIARQVCSGPDALQKQSGVLEVRVYELDCGSRAGPGA
jgi:hypothetical protein